MYVDSSNKKKESKMNRWKGSKPIGFIGGLIKNNDVEIDIGDECLLCNKGIRGESQFWVRCVEGSNETIAHHDDGDFLDNDADAMSGDMYWFSIGSECVKKIRKELKEQGLNPKDYISHRCGVPAKESS
tara:strand:+ start:250 stop:636 length:387 start_codon:yes stop_codon:yes gene_type:complete